MNKYAAYEVDTFLFYVMANNAKEALMMANDVNSAVTQVILVKVIPTQPLH